MSLNLELPGASGIHLDGATACFTGHRPKDIYGYNKALYVPVVDFLESLLRSLSAAGVSRFISGGAQGFDQLAFWAVNRLRKDDTSIKNEVYVPFPKQASAWKDTGLFSQAEHRQMLTHATAIDILSDDPKNKAAAVQALHHRNHKMVDDSDFVIAFMAPKIYSVDLAKAEGGTAECIRYALKHKKPVLSIQHHPGQPDPFRVVWLPV